MGRWSQSWVPVVGALAVLLASPAQALTAAVDAVDKVSIPRTYMVEFMDGYDIGSFYNELADERISVSPRLNMTFKLFQGASFTLSAEEAEGGASSTNRIAKFPGVRMLWPVKSIQPPAEETIWTADQGSMPPNSPLRRRQEGDASEEGGAAADTFSPHLMTQVDKLKAAGFTGKGFKIALVDTGVDYTHPALGGCFGEGCLISYGHDYVGDNLDEFPENQPIPDDDPYDGCNGHGTHIAGIIAARDNPYGFTGVAPGVELGAYRVSSCRGRVHEDIYMAGFSAAFDAGSNIITTSTQFSSDWSEDAAAVLLERITAMGVPCIVPMGNNGLSGLWSTGSPAVGRGVVAVASVTNIDYPLLLKRATYTIGEGGENTDFGWQVGRFGDFGNTTKSLYYIPDPEDGNCDNFVPADTPNLSNHIVLVSVSGCDIYNKTSIIMDFGGRDVIGYSDDFTTYELRVYPLAVNGLGMISAELGKLWMDEMAKGNEVILHMTSSSRSEDFIYSPVNTISRGYLGTTTSWGLGWELDIKPQFAAPGGNILSTYPLRLSGGYAVKSGTSMASPFAAGVYALISEARGTHDPASIENVLASNANPNLWFDGEQLHLDILAPVPQQGAGLIQAYDAAMAKTIVDKAGISFNDTEHFVESVDFVLANSDDTAVVYTLSHVKAATVYTSGDQAEFLLAAFPNPTADAYAELEFSDNNITIPAGGIANVTVKVAPPKGLDATRLPVYSGYIAINATNGESLSIPYVGVSGNMKDIPIVDTRNISTFLQLWDTEHRLHPLEAESNFTVFEPVADEPPTLSRRMPYPSAIFLRQAGTAFLQIFIEALDQTNLNTTDFMGTNVVGSLPGYPLKFVPRGVTEEAFTGMLADGTIVPPGRYQFVMKALRIFGEENKAEDYETVTVGPFVLEYGDPGLPDPSFPFGFGKA